MRLAKEVTKEAKTMKKEDIDAQIEKSKYPLRKYYRNVLDFIENKCAVKSEEHRDKVNAGKVCPGIGFDLDKPIESPRHLFGKIFFTEAFFGFLWTEINWLYTSFEKVYVKKNNAMYFGKDIEFTPELKKEVERAYELFNWGRTLREKYSEWPTELLDFSKEDCSWLSKITNIWIRAIGFIFYHEYAHAIGIKDEKEADQNAIYNVCLYDNPDETEIVTNVLGAVGAWVSLFFLIDNPGLIEQGDHPDLDDRLNDLIKAVEPKLSEDKVAYLKMFCSIAVNMFCKINGLSNEVGKPGKDENEIWQSVLVSCQEIKKSFKSDN